MTKIQKNADLSKDESVLNSVDNDFRLSKLAENAYKLHKYVKE